MTDTGAYSSNSHSDWIWHLLRRLRTTMLVMIVVLRLYIVPSSDHLSNIQILVQSGLRSYSLAGNHEP